MTGKDVGLEAIDRIFDMLQIDDEWSVRRPRGFTWWSYRLAQHIDATEPWQDEEFQLSRIRVRTDLVNVNDPSRRPEEFVALMNAQETLSAVVWDPQERSFSEHCMLPVAVDEDVGVISGGDERGVRTAPLGVVSGAVVVLVTGSSSR